MTAIEPTVSMTGKYSTTETCKVLGITANTLRSYARSGRIRIGGIHRYNGRAYFNGRDILICWKGRK